MRLVCVWQVSYTVYTKKLFSPIPGHCPICGCSTVYKKEGVGILSMSTFVGIGGKGFQLRECNM